MDSSHDLLQLFTEIRRPRRRRSSSKGWTNGSVWSVVCALELGLLTESSFKDVSIEKFSDGTPIAPKNAGKSIRSFSKPGADRRVRAGGRRFAEASRESFAVDRTTRSSLRQSYRRKKRSGRTNESCSGKSRSENGSRRRGAPFKSKDVLGARRTSRKIRKDVAKSSMSTYDRVEIDDTVVIDNENVNEDVSESGRPVDVASRGKEDLRGECAKIMESYKFEIFKEIKSYIDRRMILNGGLNGDDSSINFEVNMKENEDRRRDLFIERLENNGRSEKHQNLLKLIRRTSLEGAILQNVIDNASRRKRIRRKRIKKSISSGSTSSIRRCEKITEKHIATGTEDKSEESSCNLKRNNDASLVENQKKQKIYRETFVGIMTKQNARPMTRKLTQIIKDNYKVNFIGRLVWGFSSGWWPAIIIDAEHAGMLAETGKVWVYWIGESLISLLNERSQVEPFFNKLETRLTTDKKSNSRARARVIDCTIQMIRKQCNCTLTKPYHIWIEKNLLEPDGNEMCFYPYPSAIQDILNRLKKKNSEIIKKFNQKNSSKNARHRIKELSKPAKKCIAEISNDVEYLSLMDQEPGIIAWAKICGHTWWPAVIINYNDCFMPEPNFGCQWVMWYGGYQLSQIDYRSFLKFDVGMRKMHSYIERIKHHSYVLSVLHASKDYCSHLGCNTEKWTIIDALNYFSKEFSSENVSLSKTTNFKKNKYSALITKKLNLIKINSTVDHARRKNIMNSELVRSIKAGTSIVNTLCLRCLKISQDETDQHPFFNGSLCKNCSEFFKSRIFLFDNDGKCFFCTVCANDGIVVMCSEDDCPRVYCTVCLKYLIYLEDYSNILSKDSWKCILCNENSKTLSGIILPRLDWKEKLKYIFHTSPRVNEKRFVNPNFTKKKMRVLSLFDGISSGLFVLKKLNMVVDVYYASEIDQNAIFVSSSYFGDQVIHLGDVRNISEETIKCIAPIDLLIGGSPCNDLSLANTKRLGLYDSNGTGILFFEYCRIKKLLQKANKDQHLFWLFENVASMPTKWRLEINKYLGQEPDVIDAVDFSPQHRSRLYWHNFPINANLLPSEEHKNLQDILTPNCDRYAFVKKIRTVTTRYNSLKQSKLSLKPILMKEEIDMLWITELEEIFGFPRHYTDVRSLSMANRLKLIGQSWSVQTLTTLLRSLSPFF